MTTTRTRSKAARAPRGATTLIKNLTGSFRPHPRGFGFITLNTPTLVGTDIVTSVFVPPTPARKLLADDIVTFDAEDNDGRLALHKTTHTRRARTLVFGRITTDADKTVLDLDPDLGTTPLPITTDETPGTWAVYDLSKRTILDTYDTFGPSAARAMVLTRANLRGWANDDVTLHAQALAKTAKASLARKPAAARRDLRNLTTVTIDGPTSKDLDDAISVERRGTTHRVHVHVADVSAHVPHGSVTDNAAQVAGTTVYLPSWNRPMLPRTLSEQALSLLPDVDRDTMTVAYDIDTNGVISNIDVFRARIISDAQLTYEATSAYLDGDTGAVPARLTSVIGAAASAAHALGLERDQRPETNAPRQTNQTRQGAVTGSYYDNAEFTSTDIETEYATSMLIERLMVGANEAVATWLTNQSLPGIFRIHSEPASDLREDLEAFIGHLPTTERTPLDGNTPVELVINTQARPSAGAGPELLYARHQERATYSAEAGAHYGLGSNGYLHFTSPLRRYADLFVHRVIGAHLDGDIAQLSELTAAAPSVAEHLTVASSQAAFAENTFRRIAAVATDVTPGTTVRGVVTGYTAAGVTVRLTDLGVSGVLPYATMPGKWATDERRVSTSNGQGRSYIIGQRVRVRVDSVDPATTTIEFRAASRRGR
jgi:ribonuclease R